MPDEDVITTLTQVKGIGRWTAEMFLMFHLQRPDVLPLGDLGVVTGFAKVYGGGTKAHRRRDDRPRRELAPVPQHRLAGTCGAHSKSRHRQCSIRKAGPQF